jgi:hypothetical protein
VPVEVGSRLIESVPAVVDKLPSAAERVKREIVLARFLGKLVVDQSVRELRTRLAPERAHGDPDASEPEPLHPDPERNGAPATAPQPTDVSPVEVPDVAPADIPDVTMLALTDYDHLSSAQIVGKLDGLDDAEREAIERYERAGRHRRTILGKLDQLRTASS